MPCITLPHVQRLLAEPFEAGRWSVVLGGDCHVRIGCRPPAVGRDRALAELRAFSQWTAGIGGQYWDGWSRRGALLIETEFLTCPPEPILVVPCFIVARVAHARIRDLRFYLDLGSFRRATAPPMTH